MGKEIIKMGVVWIVNPSHLIQALSDHWALGIASLTPFLKEGVTVNRNLSVANLMLPN